MEAVRRLRPAHQSALLAGAASIGGALGPWFTGEPMRILGSEGPVTRYGFEAGGWGIALAALGAIALLLFARDPRTRDALATLAFTWAAALSASHLLMVGFMTGSPERHWGLPLAAGGSALGLLLCAAGADWRRTFGGRRPNP